MFPRIRNEYRDLRSKFLHLVRMQENMDQKTFYLDTFHAISITSIFLRETV